MDETIKRQGYYIIAEIGVNYYDIAKIRGIGIMEAAKMMCFEAKKAGADAVKFQTYKAEKLASKISPSYWDLNEEATQSQYELFKKYDSFGEEEYAELSEYCKSIDVEFMSTPFDFDSVDYLDKYIKYYKISSSDLNNIPLIKYIAQKDKPILLSTGASNKKEIDIAVQCIKKINHKKLTLLHCILEYPTPFEHANLNKIISLQKEYPDVRIGYSDHTKMTDDCFILHTAFDLGAAVIEKHFTLEKHLKGNDHYHAMDPKDIIRIKKMLDTCVKIRGSYELESSKSEEIARINARRSIVANIDIREGTILTEGMLTYKRPGNGIGPEKVDMMLGKKAKKYIKKDTQILLEDLR